MNSPSSALLWELWRKNRWGFGLLFVLLLIGVGLRLYVDRVGIEERRLQSTLERRTTGSFLLDELLPRSEGKPMMADGRIQVGKFGYSGPLSPGDKLSWSGRVSAQSEARIAAYLNSLELCQDEPLPAGISIAVQAGGKRTISFAESLEWADETSGLSHRRQTWRRAALGWSLVSITFSFLVLCAAFASAEPHSTRGFTGIPPRRFTLPVTTWTLVAWPLGFGAAVTVVGWMAWSTLVLSGLTEGVRVPHLYFAILIPASLALFQMLVWGLASFPRLRAWVITGVMLAVVGLATFPWVAPIGSFNWSILEGRMTLAFAGAGLVASVAAVCGVQWERQGKWAGWSRPGVSDPIGRFKQPARAFIASPQGQFWIEWRRNGRFALALWVVLVCGAVGAAGVARTVKGGQPWLTEIIWTVMTIAALAWVVVTGLNLARDGVSGHLALSSFTASRPLATVELLQAKFKVGATVWTSAVALTAAAFVFDGLAGGYRVSLSDGIIPAIMLTAISLHVFVGILPLCLTGRLAGLPWSLLPLLLIYGIVINSAHWITAHRPSSLFPILLALLGLKLLVAFWSFRRILRLDLVPASFVRQVLGLWSLTAGLLVWGAYELHASAEWSADTLVFVPAAALIVPLARIGLSPLALAMNRHR